MEIIVTAETDPSHKGKHAKGSIPSPKLKSLPSTTVRSVSLPDIVDVASIHNSQIQLPTIGPPAKDSTPWQQRRERIESALSWLRRELEFIRAQDKQLLSTLQQCQASIENLKRQRISPEREKLSEDDEDGMHWEDWEISEFDKSYEEQHGSFREQNSGPKIVINNTNNNHNTKKPECDNREISGKPGVKSKPTPTRPEGNNRDISGKLVLKSEPAPTKPQVDYQYTKSVAVSYVTKDIEVTV